MANLGDEFKRLMNHERPDSTLLVPLLVWTSGNMKDIELCQRINKHFFSVNTNINIGALAYNISLNHLIPYPKSFKEDEKMEFFYADIARYFGWSKKELRKNMSVIDEKELAPLLATVYGYDNNERKLLNLETFKGLKGRDKSSTKGAKSNGSTKGK